MLRKVELIALLITDIIFLCLAFLFYYQARFRWGWVAPSPEPPWPFIAMMLLTGAWMILFMFSGLYRAQFAPSRFDELILLFKVVTIGSLVLFFIAFSNFLTSGSSRPNLLLYWGSTLGFVATGRMLIRSVQILLLNRGYGAHKALIVGWSERVHELYQEVAQYPAPGLRITGAVQMRRQNESTPVNVESTPVSVGTESQHEGNGAVGLVLGISEPIEDVGLGIDELPSIIEKRGIQDLLLVLGPNDQPDLMRMLQVCDGLPIVLKLVPDYYHILNGMARTEQIYGLPLIEVLPEPMRTWERYAKRGVDLVVSFLLMVFGAPLWIIVGISVRLSSPGPAIYRQERVGKDSRNFMMYKFRTMRKDAEAGTGPVWASENDPRYTQTGRWLRKTRFDEIPQMWNVFKGEMSLVGPRPERPFFVEKLVKEIPLYSRRLRVKPGITGLAQVKWKYDETLDDVRQKVKYDLSYISNMSLGMDLKILFATVRTAILGKGQ